MENYNVNINYTFRNTESTEPLKEYAQEKITNCLKKYVHQDVDVQVKLEVEKHRQIAEVTFNCFGTNFTNSEESESMYKSIDSVIDTVSTRLRRQKDKATSRH